VKTNKSDFIDAEAIAEAVARPTMRFVPIKTDDQLDLQSLHRVRERWVMRRTAVINQIRGLLLERDLSERIRNILRRVSKSLRPETLSQFDRAEMQECLRALEQVKMLMSELEILHLLSERRFLRLCWLPSAPLIWDGGAPFGSTDRMPITHSLL